MEKFWFETGRGYVNVDEYGIYYSDSGNWQAIQDLPEFPNARIGKRKRSIWSHVLSVFIPSLIWASIISFNPEFDLSEAVIRFFKIALLLFGLKLVAHFISYLSKEPSVVFKTPWENISGWKVEANGHEADHHLHISFTKDGSTVTIKEISSDKMLLLKEELEKRVNKSEL